MNRQGRFRFFRSLIGCGIASILFWEQVFWANPDISQVNRNVLPEKSAFATLKLHLAPKSTMNTHEGAESEPSQSEQENQIVYEIFHDERVLKAFAEFQKSAEALREARVAQEARVVQKNLKRRQARLKALAVGLFFATVKWLGEIGFYLILYLSGVSSGRQDLSRLIAGNAPSLIEFHWILGMLILASYGEEFIFRDKIYRFLESRIGRHKANILQAGFFTIYHYGYYFIPSALSAILYTIRSPLAIAPKFFISGLVYGLAYQKAGLLGSTLTHITTNLMAFLLINAPFQEVLIAGALLAGLDAFLWWHLLRSKKIAKKELSPKMNPLVVSVEMAL